MGKKQRGAGGASIPATSPAIAAVVGVIVLVYYATVFVLLDHWLGLRSPSGGAHAAAFSFITASCFLSFVVAAARDPGSVPALFAPETEDPQMEGVKSRYCDKCSMHKPPRAHHCKVCKRCVLKMDHHCVWISNCVGYTNYKAFIICVLNAAIGSIYSTVIFICVVLQKEHGSEVIYLKLFYIVFGVIIVLLSVTTGSLLCWHIYLLSHNMTTIEYREAVRAKWLAKKSGQKYRHCFDLGLRRNLVMILGPNVLCWFCPTATGYLKDGTQFPISNE